MERFTEEELAIAKQVDLTKVATYLGYTVKRIGRYHTLKEMDSIRIYNCSHWFRWSRRYDKGENGGSQIDFLRVFQGLEVKEAVAWLLDFAGYVRRGESTEKVVLKYQVQPKEPERKAFILPERAEGNGYLYRYLMHDRGISREVIDYFVEKDLIYEAKQFHNIVFLGKSWDGQTKFASMRGVFDKNGKGFKCDVRGNDKRYGFNDVHEDSVNVVVFEAAIDLMSYVELTKDHQSNKIALGMLADAPLETFLAEHPHIKKIRFCLDNDEPGQKATKELMEKYKELGYTVWNCPPHKDYKDYNEWLVASKVCSDTMSDVLSFKR